MLEKLKTLFRIILKYILRICFTVILESTLLLEKMFLKKK